MQEQSHALENNFVLIQAGAKVTIKNPGRGFSAPLLIIGRTIFILVTENNQSKILGKGGTGVVKLFKKILSPDFFAVKIIALTNASLQKIALNETQAWSILGHSNQVCIIKSKEAIDKIYLPMPYFEGKNLYQLFQENYFKQLDAQQIVALYHKIIQAVKILHDKDLIHRDIKLENFLLCNNGNIRLLDFGFTTSKLNATKDACCGSIAYAAPEVIRPDNPINNQQSDIFSLGTLLSEIAGLTKEYVPSNATIQHTKLIFDECRDSYLFTKAKGFERFEIAMFKQLCRMMTMPKPAERIKTIDIVAECFSDNFARWNIAINDTKLPKPLPTATAMQQLTFFNSAQLASNDSRKPKKTTSETIQSLPGTKELRKTCSTHLPSVKFQ